MWYNKSTPDQIQPRPWLSDAAVRYFESLLTSEMIVMEFGGGGSTLWLAERVNSIVVIEINPQWKKAIEEFDKKNIYTHISLQYAFYPPIFDLLFIDGEPIELRAEWLKAAKDIVKAGGYVVLDNANRPEYAKERVELDADLIHTVDANVGALKYLVTEFYRMR